MLTVENVSLVYSGKPGCACGCLGKYYYPTTADLKAAGAERGYEIDRDEVSDAMVKKVVRLINESGALIHEDCKWAETEINGRVYVAYLTKDAERMARVIQTVIAMPTAEVRP